MRDRLLSFALLAALAFVPVACGGGGGGDAAAPPPTTAAPAPAADADVSAEATAADASEGGFGVPECDEYFTKYFACIDANVPEAARAAARQAAEATRASLQQAAEQPGGAEHLATACTTAQEQAEQAMAAYNCAW
jgi:hypothetical protein